MIYQCELCGEAVLVDNFGSHKCIAMVKPIQEESMDKGMTKDTATTRIESMLDTIDYGEEYKQALKMAIKALESYPKKVTEDEIDQYICDRYLSNTGICWLPKNGNDIKTMIKEIYKYNGLLKEEPVKLKKYKIRTTIQGVRLISDEYYTDEEIKEMSLLWEKDLSTKIEE